MVRETRQSDDGHRANVGSVQPPHTAPTPLRIDNPDSIPWSDTADVVVVGFGGAGVAAALQAIESGASVLAIDRFEGGGATAYSGGVIYAGGTKYQRQSGFDDTPEEMFKYLQAEGSAVGPDTLRRFCEGSNADIEWLESHGVPHGGNAFTDKTNFPPDGHWIYYSGNEKLPAFSSVAKPAPRGHRTLTSGFGGKLHFERLRASALAKGVRLLQHAPVTRLVVDAGDRVVGVEVNALPAIALVAPHEAVQDRQPWRPFNGERAERAIAECATLERTCAERRLIRARRGVALASGGFIYNLEALRAAACGARRELPQPAEARIDGRRRQWPCARTIDGRHHGSDGSYLRGAHRRPAQRVSERHHGQRGGTTLRERRCLRVRRRCRGRGAARQRQGLARSRGTRLLDRAEAVDVPGQGPVSALGRSGADQHTLWRDTSGANSARSCAQVRRGCRRAWSAASRNTMPTSKAKRPDPLGKFPDLHRPIERGPYFAVNFSLSNRFAPAQAFTLGGLVVDEATGAVKRADGTTVDGLYAAGRVAVGLCSKGYMSGLSIADTVFSGRRAGQRSGTLRCRG